MSSSPCVGVCTLYGDVCIGCKRTIEEITGWKNMSKDDRQRVMEDIKSRIVVKHKCPKCRNESKCAMEAGKSANLCWCMTVEKDTNTTDYVDCLCKTCLTGENNVKY